MTLPSLRIDDSVTVRSGSDDQPLLLLLHGYGSHERDLAGLVPHLPVGLAAAAIRAPLTMGPGSYAWVPIDVPGRPDPAALEASTVAVLDWLDSHVGDDRAVSLLGFSQGGLMVTQLMRARPERFVSGLVLSGFVHDGVQPGDDALAQRRPPVFFGRGDADTIIAPDASRRASSWLPRHVETTEKVYPGLDHGISAEELRDVIDFLRQHAVTSHSA